MSSRTIDFPHCPRNATLAACLAAALGLTAASAHSNDLSTAHMSNDSGPKPVKPAVNLPAYLGISGGRLAGTSHPTNTPDALPHYVTSCGDDIATPGTLRYEVANAPNGATIDLSMLVCSTITLSHNAIAVNQDSLYLHGPATGTLTIDGNNQSSVFYHFGVGTFGISNITIANGYYVGSMPSGGCIYSHGNVQLSAAIVSKCTLASSSNAARGAAIYTQGDLTLVDSTITGGHAIGLSGANAEGGGVFVSGYFAAKYSTINDNTVAAVGPGYGFGGGADTGGNVYIRGSTISGNQGQFYGGLALNGGAASTATIIDSTISSNTASQKFAGIWTNMPLTLANSTVAFNRSAADTLHSEGLYSLWAPLTLQSSIIADNSDGDGQSDLGGVAGVVVTGADNLVTSSTLMTPVGTITVTACPQLGPLVNNGGSTRTHALMHASPAIDHGHATPGVTVDQRQAPRSAGPQVDVGSVEWQPGETDDRVFVSGFDALCDQ